MTARDLPCDAAQLVHQLQDLYGLPEAEARQIVSEPELAAMARSFVEGKIAYEASVERLFEALRRFEQALAGGANRR